tara:strand:- start:10254 stop:10709 length:456 start_codon:yes stop_codon:yes gene_type:complete
VRINQPITDEQHAQADRDYEALALRQKAYFTELANRLEAGESLSAMDRKLAASLMRRASDAISTKRKRPRGQPVQVPDIARWEYARLIVHRGLSSNEAIEELSERYSSSIESIKAKLGMVRAKPGWEVAKAETKMFLQWEQGGDGTQENKT